MPKWEKLGQLYHVKDSSARHEKLRSHAANPLAVPLQGDEFRIYYSGRDAHKRSSVGAVDVNIKTREVLHDHHAPFFEHGAAGSFYEAGVSIGCWYEAANGARYMLFMGWQNPPNGHWRGDIGRLLLHADGGLSLAEPEAFIGASGIDPISLSYPWVCRRGAQDYIMWYGSTLSWDAGNGEMVHVIQQAISCDGNDWQCLGQAVPHRIGYAQAFSRPTVLLRGGIYQMWFSYRSGSGEAYRIGYAYSDNGKDWTLAPEQSGITVSKEGWDSDMVCYPFVFEHAGEVYMLYNGNGYGQSGFGLAVLQN